MGVVTERREWWTKVYIPQRRQRVNVDGAEVDGVTDEVGLRDLGGVDLDDCSVFGAAFVADV